MALNLLLKSLIHILSDVTKFRNTFTSEEARALVDLYEDISGYEGYPGTADPDPNIKKRKILDLDLK